MDITKRAPRTLLKLFESSTARKLYSAEIQVITGLAPVHLRSVLFAMVDSGWLVKEKEKPNFESRSRALRTYYSLSARGVSMFRMQSDA